MALIKKASHIIWTLLIEKLAINNAIKAVVSKGLLEEFGEDRVLEYFFRDSPTDAARISDPYLRETMLANIDYCFRDPSQIARDVGDWGADWSAFLTAVAERAPVKFIHGADHTFHLASSIEALIDGNQNISGIFLDAAQLALYEHPQEVAAQIREF